MQACFILSESSVTVIGIKKTLSISVCQKGKVAASLVALTIKILLDGDNFPKILLWCSVYSFLGQTLCSMPLVDRAYIPLYI